MSTLLLVLLAFSFGVVLLGYLLSLRSQARSQDAAYYADSYPKRVRGIRQNGISGVPPVPLRTRRSIAHASFEVREGIWPFAAVGRLLRRPGEPTSWMGIGLILVTLFLFGMVLFRTLLPNVGLVGFAISSTSTKSSVQATPNPLLGTSNASKSLVRLSQLDPAQYGSAKEYDLWAYSACSTASMTEVMNSYGHHYRITDILKVESQIGEITPQLGLLEDIGVERTASHFGFQTIWGHQFSLDQIISIANKGRPVIVSFPPDRYAGGHLVVVTGGNSSSVNLADSSLYNRQVLSRAQFLKWWGGFYAVLIPNSQWK